MRFLKLLAKHFVSVISFIFLIVVPLWNAATGAVGLGGDID